MQNKQIKEQIKSKIKNELSNATKNTYTSQIFNTFKRMFPNEETFNPSLFNIENIKKHVENLKNINSRKTIYSALMQVVDKKTKEAILPLMLTEINTYTQQIEAGVPSKNMITLKQIKRVFNELKREHGDKLKEKKDLSTFELWGLQKLMVVATVAGLFVPPRRNEWLLMKIKDIDKDKDNYIDHNKKEFVFNTFKTSKSYGQQRVQIPDKLYKLLILYIKRKILNSDYLFSQRRGEPFISATFSQFLNSIFRDYGSISSNSFRHAFLTEKYGNTKTLTKDLKNMGTSIKQLDTYVD